MELLERFFRDTPGVIPIVPFQVELLLNFVTRINDEWAFAKYRFALGQGAGEDETAIVARFLQAGDERRLVPCTHNMGIMVPCCGIKRSVICFNLAGQGGAMSGGLPKKGK
jgi:hypothetical protein